MARAWRRVSSRLTAKLIASILECVTFLFDFSDALFQHGDLGELRSLRFLVPAQLRFDVFIFLAKIVDLPAARLHLLFMHLAPLLDFVKFRTLIINDLLQVEILGHLLADHLLGVAQLAVDFLRGLGHLTLLLLLLRHVKLELPDLFVGFLFTLESLVAHQLSLAKLTFELGALSLQLV